MFGKKKLFLTTLGALLIANTASAQDGAGPLKFFSEQKEYVADLYVLNDYVEFSVFDMSKLNLFINSRKIDLRPMSPTESEATGEPAVPPVPPPTETQSEREIKAILPEIPKYFYKELKAAIHREKVPVTLFATDSPAYARPIKLYVKLKKISLAPGYTDKKGAAIQPVGIKIYGQLKDKANDRVLTRFYDVQTAEFPLGREAAESTFAAMAARTMENLARYMKTKY